MNTIGKLRENEQMFKNDRLHRLILDIRRFRSEQLQELLSYPEEMDLQTFNQEVWPLGHAYLPGDEKIDVYQLKDPDTMTKLEEALQKNILVYKGNSMWGAGTRVFAPMIKNEIEKIELIRAALDILTSEEYTPEEKAKHIQDIKGFGPNISTGLVMVFHPKAFMIYNEKSKEAYRLLTGEIGNPEDFQQYMQQLKEDLHMEDFLELDYFLYTWLQTNSDDSLDNHLSRIFSTESNAEWSFDFIADVLKRLGVERSDDERLSITYQRTYDGIHVNFCNWIILGFYPSGKIRIPLFQKYEDFQHIGRLGSFTQKENEPEILTMSCPRDQLNDQIRKGMEETLDYIAKRFETYSKSPYRRHHLSSLGEAIFESSKRVHLMQSGIPDHELNRRRPRKVNYWLFQGNPNVFDVIGFLQEEGVKPWSVNSHRNTIKPDDKVIIWITGAESGCYALATVLSDVYEIEDGEYKCDLEIDRLLFDDPILKDDIEEEEALQNLKAGNQGTNFKSSEAEFEAMVQLAEAKNETLSHYQSIIQNPEYTIEDLQTETGMDSVQVGRWLRSLHRKGQAILYGPPGTGKTYMAKKMAQHLIGGNDGFYEVVQFHPAYAYEDFIQGIRPQQKDGVLDYPLLEGRFLEFCQRARRKQGECVLIIDEINRANLSRVFGELMYLLEYRDQEVPLAGGGILSIPNNVRIIGTMNTADRSIALMDHALRRRFAFLPIWPSYEILRNYHQNTNTDVEGLISTLQAINREIGDSNLDVGISFFLLESLDEELEDIWRMEIEPYLEECFFDRPEKMDTFRWEQVKNRLQV